MSDVVKPSTASHPCTRLSHASSHYHCCPLYHGEHAITLLTLLLKPDSSAAFSLTAVCLCPVGVQVLGFPIQLLGLLALPYLGIRWYVDGQDAGKDIEEYAVSCVKKIEPCNSG